MHLLLVKMSSMGDLVHTLPAVNDALNAVENLQISWLVEEAFVDIPLAHPRIHSVIPICFRRFMRSPIKTRDEFFGQIKALRAEQFDQVLDAQGLIKSALLARLSGCRHRIGYDASSAREGLAAVSYTEAFSVPRHLHALDRSRLLFAQALGYTCPENTAQFGLKPNVEKRLVETQAEAPYGIFLHGTTWCSKQWPEVFWKQLAQKVTQAGFGIKLLAGNVEELARAQRIGSVVDNSQVLDKPAIADVMVLCAKAAFVISVDTGFGHLAAALDTPVLSLFGPTNAELTGIRGANSLDLQVDFACAPCMQKECNYKGSVQIDNTVVKPACFSSLGPELVWQTLQSRLGLGNLEGSEGSEGSECI
ncbi:MAG: lipopolysaccharide heptosyltransferase I [Pseudomonadales bacterium]|nr:lipopolysaccharide heptosyltransferase I [Pseudomonadales bacterium]